jgi:hypothetical protein
MAMPLSDFRGKTWKRSHQITSDVNNDNRHSSLCQWTTPTHINGINICGANNP